jgi:hypothetical protein
MSRWIFLALLVGFLSWTTNFQARADEVIRLGSSQEGAKTLTLGLNDDDADTELIHWGRRFYGRSYGFYGGYYGGYRGGYYRSYYRPYYGFGVSYYRPYYSYRSYYSPYYSSSFYSYPSYYSYPAHYGVYSPCATTTAPTTPTVVLGQSTFSSPVSNVAPAPANRSNGTFPYNGGPASIIPEPSENDPIVEPKQPTVPREGKLVSLPSTSSPAYVYRAYTKELSIKGTTTQAPTRTISTPVEKLSPPSTVRVNYPAFGESKNR